MGWFDKQIRQRMENDREVLEDSFLRMAGAIMDKWDVDRLEDEWLIAENAIGDILKYYRLKPIDIPDSIHDINEQLAYALRAPGMMTRVVNLEEGWQSDAYGPMLARLKDEKVTVALLPGKVSGYYFKDPVTGRKTLVTRKNAGRLDREALCFYRPLPMKKLGIPDLLLYMRGCISRGDVILIVLAALAVQLTGMIEPRVYSLVTGTVMKTRNVNLMAGLGVFLLTSAFAAQLISLVQSLLMQRIGTKTTQSVEAAVMMRILSLPVSFFRKYSSGELSGRAGSVSSLCNMLISGILSTGLTSLVSLLYVAQIFAFAPALVWPSLLIILGTVTVSVAASILQIGISRERMTLGAKEQGMSFAVMNGIQKIRLSGSEKRAFARWGRLYAREARLDYNPPVFLKLSGVITSAISLIGTIVLYYLAVRTGVGANQYYAFSAAYGRVMGAFTSLAGIVVSAAQVRPVLEMAEPILKAEPEIASNKRPVERVSGNIEVSHVSFRYEENMPYVLQDLSLTIRSGEYVAIVGRTGCGKSTLVRLLLGFEKPEKGGIYYDRSELGSIDPRTLRRHIGVVIQNGQLFQGDIFSNISISAPDLTLDEAWQAAETAGIAQDIRDMPMGMHTMISEGQGGISGGQKQRLMIARAIASKPKILIFDEATSALDNKTQKQVSDALDNLHCTRIVIAHRLSTIRGCDRILVMDKGAIIEEGTYEELIAQNGYFADLVARQRLDTGTDRKPADSAPDKQ